jgi:predicted DNA binding CopG/RHH family protein
MLFKMDDLKIPTRKYYSDEKQSVTYRYPKAWLKRVKQEAAALGMRESELIILVIDLWLQKQDQATK